VRPLDQSGKTVDLTVHQHKVDAAQALVESAGEKESASPTRSVPLWEQARLRCHAHPQQVSAQR
jgi:hypothetical protein